MAEEFSKDEFVTVFSSREHDAEVEAETIHGLLKSAGLRSMIVRENVTELPVGLVSVRVLSSEEQEARNLIEQAQQSSASESDEDESR